MEERIEEAGAGELIQKLADKAGRIEKQEIKPKLEADHIISCNFSEF